MVKLIDITGRVYGRLTVLNRVANKGSFTCWSCSCSCGKTVVVTGQDIRSGDSKSCGCYKAEKQATRKGLSNTSEYNSWKAMVARCTDTSHTHYAYYGGRGIGVYPLWLTDYNAFFDYLGKKPTPTHSLDKIDNSIGYYPGNVRWSTKVEQAQNRRNIITVLQKGVATALSSLPRHSSVSAKLAGVRLKKLGWSVDKALTTPVLRPKA